ncbi:putative leader peptide [Streptomyces sp. NPDC091292]|uniref:putative leader peptide n=1 Tax=Streptomyces sp. NPDC091292 TaxID=3365991 RepID=UPI0037F914D6
MRESPAERHRYGSRRGAGPGIAHGCGPHVASRRGDECRGRRSEVKDVARGKAAGGLVAHRQDLTSVSVLRVVAPAPYRPVPVPVYLYSRPHIDLKRVAGALCSS